MYIWCSKVNWQISPLIKPTWVPFYNHKPYFRWPHGLRLSPAFDSCLVHSSQSKWKVNGAHKRSNHKLAESGMHSSQCMHYAVNHVKDQLIGCTGELDLAVRYVLCHTVYSVDHLNTWSTWYIGDRWHSQASILELCRVAS